MWRVLDGDLPEPRWPEGVAVRAYVPADAVGVKALLDDAYAAWDDAYVMRTQNEWQRWMTQHDEFDPELWFLVENLRWGKLTGKEDFNALISKVNREDLWREAAKALSVPAAQIPQARSRGVEKFFDGKVFDPGNPSAYLASLDIKRAA